MTTRFPRDEEYFQLHLEHYQEAIAAALFTGDSFHHDFRVTVEDVTPLAATEIAVNFKVRAPATNAPADIASIPATAALVLAKMTVSDLNPKVIAKGLAEALDVTGAQICMTTPIDFELAQCYDGGFGGGDGSGGASNCAPDGFTIHWGVGYCVGRRDEVLDHPYGLEWTWSECWNACDAQYPGIVVAIDGPENGSCYCQDACDELNCGDDSLMVKSGVQIPNNCASTVMNI